MTIIDVRIGYYRCPACWSEVPVEFRPGDAASKIARCECGEWMVADVRVDKSHHERSTVHQEDVDGNLVPL